jgi:hypothetical protein
MMTSKTAQARGSEVVPATDVIALDEVERALLDTSVRLSVPEAEPEDATRAIIRSILEAEDPLAGLEVTPARELLGVPIMLTDVEWRNSDFSESGPGIFAIMRGQLEDGSSVIVSCGGANVLAQLYRLVKDGRIPEAIVIEESKKPTAKGYRPLWITGSKFEEGKDPLRARVEPS